MRLEFARLAAAISVLTLSATAIAQIPSPTIEGPITGPGNPFVASTGFDLAQLGYEQAEYFISGTASAYTNTAPLAPDGMWSAARNGATAAYKTRLLVYRMNDVSFPAPGEYLVELKCDGVFVDDQTIELLPV